MATPQNRVTTKISEKFKDRLLKILDDEGCSKSELARRSRISYAVMSHMTVYGIVPTTAILIKLANCLEFPMAYILGESDNKEFYKSEVPTTFHVRLEELRKEKNTTYPKIANILNFPDSYFRIWIYRRSLPFIDYIKPIAEYFKVSIDYLLGRTDYRD